MRRHLLLCAALVLTVPLVGCTAAPDARPAASPSSGAAMRLVAFDSCDQLIADLRRAAKASVGPYGFGGGRPELLDGGIRVAQGAASKVDSAAEPVYSGTNVHESQADEPDLVKTDGRLIVTVGQGVLRVVDVATRKETGSVDLGVPNAGQLQLLLTGDSALVLVPAGYQRGFLGKTAEIDYGPQLLLVDLSGAPAIVSRYQGEGDLVDARMTGATARVVLRTTPRIQFPDSPTISDEKRRIAANRDAIDRAPADAWLPRWQVTDGAVTSAGKVDCGQVSRPNDYSGGSLVSILTFDLARSVLGGGDPVTVVADGDTVYATATSLYLASDQRWRFESFAGRAATPARQETDLYKFTFERNQPPVYRAAGTVPGYLINQYAVSEWANRLRVATTDPKTDRSAVRVLTEQNGELAQTGVVDGLGKGERIYSVRFLGDRGYVVTFRQTDPLYSLDLSDPAKPKVTGEIKITGYSAHLQPIGVDRLIGIGQEADGDGRTQGTQVSLFDVSDPAKPRRLAQYQIPGGHSEAEYDPHALLWWPAANLLVTPVSTWNGQDSKSAALTLRVTDDIKLTGEVTHPTAAGYPSMIQRSLVAGSVLWTLSDAGLHASDLSTTAQLAWLPN
jgi:uncharacterized secreted protein with C-terminal beta-propeller domain